MRDLSKHSLANLLEKVYKIRVLILLFLFVLAMKENSLHPFPLWSEAIRILKGRNYVITEGVRHLVLLFPVGIYAGSLAMRLSASVTLGSKTVWSLAPQGNRLVREGLYSCVRHPLYTGSAGMILSLSLMSSPEGAAILAGGGIPFLVFLARHEEGLFLDRIPEYAEYKKSVPPFIPSIGTGCNFLATLMGPLRSGFARGLRSEAFNVALLGGFLSFWATPSLPLFWVAFALLLGLALSAPFWIPERGKEPS